MKQLATARMFFARFITHHEEGFSIVEYALLLAFLAVVCVLGISAIGNWLSATLGCAARTI